MKASGCCLLECQSEQRLHPEAAKTFTVLETFGEWANDDGVSTTTGAGNNPYLGKGTIVRTGHVMTELPVNNCLSPSCGLFAGWG